MIIKRLKFFTKITNQKFSEYKKEKVKEIQKKNKQNLEKSLDEKRASGIYNKFSWISEIYPTLKEYIDYCKTRLNEKDVNTIALLVKDERRQSFTSEGLQSDYIREYFSEILKNGEDNKIINLPNGGPNSVYFRDGQVVSNLKTEVSKSIDIKITYNFLGKSLVFYGTMKVTDGSGGSQTNQYNDVIASNKEFVKVTDQNIYTMSILDGTFYTKSKIDQINRLYGSNKNKALHCEDVGNYLIDSIIEWIKTTFIDTTDKIISKQLTKEQLRLRKLKS